MIRWIGAIARNVCLVGVVVKPRHVWHFEQCEDYDVCKNYDEEPRGDLAA